MNDYLFNVSQPNELLTQLRVCAHNLLLAYDATLINDLWIAFEKAVGVCEKLTHQLYPNVSMTVH